MVRQYVPTSTGQQQQSFTVSIMSTTNNLAKSLELGLDEKPERTRTRTRNTLSLFFSLAHTLQYSPTLIPCVVYNLLFSSLQFKTSTIAPLYRHNKGLK